MLCKCFVCLETICPPKLSFLYDLRRSPEEYTTVLSGSKYSAVFAFKGVQLPPVARVKTNTQGI